MNIGSRIRNARQEKGLSQEELAKAIGATKSAISRYEAGKRMPNLVQIQAIAAALDGDVVYLVCGQTTTELQSGILIQAEAEAKVEFEKLQLEFQSRSFDERVSISSALIHLFKLFGRFNPIGYQKAVERVEELAEIPKYQREQPVIPLESTPAPQDATRGDTPHPKHARKAARGRIKGPRPTAQGKGENYGRIFDQADMGPRGSRLDRGE